VKKYLLDKILPALIIGLIVSAFQLYVDVQMMKREIQILRGELSDLWVQANEQIQKRP
jgi:hypothetical protein